MFSLAQQERRVVLFLLSMALVGLGVDFLSKINSRAKSVVCVNPDIGKVNLNTADKETLMSVRGIGEKLAQRIIEYRAEQMNFGGIEELKNIKGISESKYEKIKDDFIVR